MNKTLAPNYNRAFRPADIRGTYPDQINEYTAYSIARAFVEEFKYKKIVVGYDMRLSTPALRKAFIDGARESGASVID
ncbi:phosphomannomutase, partial [Candidatus Kaiserbacteria bacterium]|nr:phosphomannomutase [Candidatus Kaiserbacteria bacterium]